MHAEFDTYPLLKRGAVIEKEIHPFTGRPSRLKDPYKFIHFYYPIKDVAEEVYKMSSMIGSKRPTEAAPHQIDFYSLSEDEQTTFNSLCKNASIRVFDVMMGYTDRRIDCYQYNEGDVPFSKSENNGLSINVTSVTPTYSSTSVQYNKIISNSVSSAQGHTDLTREKFLVDNGYTYEEALDIITKLKAGTTVVLFDNIDDNTATTLANQATTAGLAPHGVTPTYTKTKHQISVATSWNTGTANVTANDKFAFHIVARYVVTNYMGERELRTIEKDVEYTPQSLTNSFSTTFILDIEIDDSTPIVPGYYAETFIGVFDASITSSKAVDVTPTPYPDLSYITYTPLQGDSILYMALQDTDSNADFNDPSLFVRAEVDFRESIHYILKKPLYIKPNEIKPVDDAIWNSIVYDVLYNWLMMISPKEAEPYILKASDMLINLKMRLNTLDRSIATPHPF